MIELLEHACSADSKGTVVAAAGLGLGVRWVAAADTVASIVGTAAEVAFVVAVEASAVR
jgi:hypothetical protein